jgi:hypothetical protein
MQVFIPYASPFDTAMVLKGDKRFLKQIIETRQILAAIYDSSKGYANHPVTKMYTGHTKWLSLYLKTFELVRDNDLMLARFTSFCADRCRPKWMTDELCDQHKRRLYTKNEKHYKDFTHLGTSLENHYVVNGEVVRYVNGKKLALSDEKLANVNLSI